MKQLINYTQTKFYDTFGDLEIPRRYDSHPKHLLANASKKLPQMAKQVKEFSHSFSMTVTDRRC